MASVLTALASEDWLAVRDAIERAGHLLRSGQVHDADLEGTAARLVQLASHPVWEVRQEVAHALLHLKHRAFKPALERLLADDSVWVVEAARRTLERRAELARCDLLKDHHERLLQRDLADVEARYDGRARKAALRVAERYAEMMVRELCHEVNRVISSIDAAHDRLEAGLGRVRVEPAACREHLAVARQRVSLLVATLDSVRELMRESRSEFRGESLRDIIAEAVELVRDQPGERARELELAVDVAPSIRLDAHRHQLRQALRNLLQNAADAYAGLERPRRIHVSASVETDAHVVVRIADQGCGMDVEQKEQALQLFATSKPGGTGFGLKLAKKIVEREHRGELHLESQPGAGTTVVLSLPIEQTEREDFA